MGKTEWNDTIVAVSTPIGEGGISIVRLSGPSSIAIADKIFVSSDGNRPSKYRTYTTHYGHIVDKSTVHPGLSRTKSGAGSPQSTDKKNKDISSKLQTNIIDEVILTVMRAPKSYTRENIVEINCHGGIQAAKKVLELVMKNGARLAEPGEFTKRAFLNGRIDLAQAEAVLDVIRAKTEGSLKVALNQLEGGLSDKIEAILKTSIDIASQVEASIDFPEEGIELPDRTRLLKNVNGALTELKKLIDTYDEGVVLREGVLAIICGKPNVGKSSLMNLLLKRDRVIVSPIPGTTRDAVEETINLKGIPIRLVDTAGIVETKDILEREGIARSKKYLGMADMAILILDYSSRIDAADLAIIKLLKDKKKVVVLNKCDLAKKTSPKEAGKLFKDEKAIEISVQTKKNIELLERSIAEAVWSGGFNQAEAGVVSNARHKELLDKALGNMLSVKKALERDESPELVAIDLKEAVFNLGLVIGKSVSEDILDRIFEQFCIGK